MQPKPSLRHGQRTIIQHRLTRPKQANAGSYAAKLIATDLHTALHDGYAVRPVA